jgi:hypothetical protein
MWTSCWIGWVLIQLYGTHATNICCDNGCRVTATDIINNNNTLEVLGNEILDANSLDFSKVGTSCKLNLYILIINNGVTAIGDGTFYNTWFLVTIDASNAAITHIGVGAFAECIALVTISFPSVVTIGARAFALCVTLKSVSIPNIRTIGSNAFEDTSALTDLYISTTSNTIGTNAFLHSYLISVDCYFAPIEEDTQYNIVNCVDTTDDCKYEILIIGILFIVIALYIWCLIHIRKPTRKKTVQLTHQI